VLPDAHTARATLEATLAIDASIVRDVAVNLPLPS